MKRKSPDVKYIAVENMVSHLGLLEVDVDHWLNRDKPEIRQDHRGRVTVPIELLDRYSNNDEYIAAFERAIAAEKTSREADGLQVNWQFERQRSELLDNYNIYIGDLETLHRKYLDAANMIGYESSTMAAYLLFSKVISILKMSCLCLRSGYWYSGSLLREVDECLDVALFFVITKGTPKGEQAIRRWFRQNHAPKHLDCREEIAIWMASVVDGIDRQQHQELFNELYQKKSKWTHPTYAVIREVTKYNTEGIISVEEIDYGSCSYERKLHELTHFFRSSIWRSFQTFILCFCHEFPLAQEDVEYLLKYDKKFQKWDSIAGEL